MRTSYISVIILGSLLLSSCTTQINKTKNHIPPNIILILADDLGYSDLGYFGSEINTPNLDRIAEKGLVMTQFYNAAGSCQSRASTLTGLYPQQVVVGDMTNNPDAPTCRITLNNQCVTLAEVLKVRGYSTLMAGEWHLGSDSSSLPLNRGFDHFFGLIDGASSYFNLNAYLTNQLDSRMMLEDKPWFPPDSGFYMTRAFTEKAVEYVNSYSSEEMPFFIYLAYTAPHWPLHALPEDIAKYKGKYNEGWEKIRESRCLKMINNGIMGMDENISPQDPDNQDWDSLSDKTKKEWSERMEVYAAMVDRMDQGVGEILNALLKTGESQNTLIIFFSDNGGCNESIGNLIASYAADTAIVGTADSFEALIYPWTNVSNTPFKFYKQLTHEGGISTPFIAFWPDGIEEASASNYVAHVIDIMPTLVAVSGASYPEKLRGNAILPMEGISLAPLFSGEEPEEHEFLIWEYEGSRALRVGDYKIVSDKSYGDWQIFDIVNDRCELEDLSEEAPQEIQGMKKIYKKQAKRLGIRD
jgi:arylsulfatase A-like enzyme